MSQHYIEVLKEGTFTIEDVFTEVEKDFKSLDLSKVKPYVRALIKMKVSITAISYNTVDPKGRPVVSGGIIMQPANRKSRGVLHFLPSANIDKFGSGSDVLLIFEGVLAFVGYTVIIADLLGNGITKDTLKYPFLMAENTGQVAYDMHLAAMEYFDQVKHKPLNRHISVGGYSMGGSAALALIRKMEQEQNPNIIIDRAIVGGGVYDLEVALEDYIRTGTAQYPATPCIMKAYDHWYDLHLDYSKIFTGPLLANQDSWLDRTHTRQELTDWIGQDMHKYLHPDFFKPERNEELNRLWTKLPENSLAKGWVPKTKLRMSHASDDITVPTRVATSTYETFKKNGANVRIKYGKGGHYTFGMWFFLRMGGHLLLKRFAFWTRS